MADRYWVGGSANWDATALLKWSLTSGGIGGEAVPTAADDVYIDSGSGAVTVTVGAASVCKNLSFTSGAGDFAGTFAGASTLAISGSLTLVSGMTYSYSGNYTFNSTSTGNTITSAGKTFGQTVTFNGVGGTWALQDNLTNGTIRATVLTNGTLDLNNNTLTSGNFSSNNANARTIAFGSSGKIIVTGNAATVFDITNGVNLSVTGTSDVELNYAGSTGTRTIQPGATSLANSLNYKISAGTDTVTLANNSGSYALAIDFTGFAGTLTALPRNIGGNLTISSGLTASLPGNTNNFIATTATTIDSANKTLDMILTFNGVGGSWQLLNNLTIPSNRTTTLTNGTLDLSSGNRTLSTGVFSSTNTNVRSIAWGTGNITLTANNATIWTTATNTNLTFTGTPTVNCTYSGAANGRTITPGALGEARAINFNISAGSDGFALSGGGASYGNMNFTGFSGIFTVGSNSLIFGNFTVSAGMSLAATTTGLLFSKTSGTQQITTASKTFDFPLTFNGIGGTFAFQDALTQGSTRAFTLTNGTVQLKNGVTSTVGAFATSGTNQKFLQSTTPGSQATLSQASGTVNASYLTIKDINATGGATWNALWSNNNVDLGNNNGWFFGDQPIVNAVEYTYKIRSFTQPRRF
jgi:hypothetical protein